MLNFDLSKDLSKKFTVVILCVILVGYVAVSFKELFVEECSGIDNCFDYDRRMARLSVWDIDWIKTDLRHSVHFILLETSYQLFHNYKVLVLGSSVLLLIVTYLFTFNITEKRIAGLLAIGILLQSSIFYRYDTSVTYPSFWALLFITSLYLTTTKTWYLSPISFIIAIPSKAIVSLFIPSILLFEWFINRKSFVLFSVLSVVGIILIFSSIQLSQPIGGGFFLFQELHLQKFLGGFVSWMWQGFAEDQSTLFLLVISWFLIFFNRKKIKNSSPVLLLVAGMILTSPILTGLTTYSIWPYRMLPLVVLVGVMIGMVYSNIKNIDLKMFGIKSHQS